MSTLLEELDRAIERGWANRAHLAAMREMLVGSEVPRAQKWNDGDLVVTWANGKVEHFNVRSW